MTKKKILMRVLKKHGNFDAWHDHNAECYVTLCDCGWEGMGESYAETDDLRAKHVYSMIKKALKKRRQVLSL